MRGGIRNPVDDDRRDEIAQFLRGTPTTISSDKVATRLSTCAQ
jgi:hypothetical protein